jgi:diadenosine tetraphosphate (Ap4A) HIT family hydrolase
MIIRKQVGNGETVVCSIDEQPFNPGHVQLIIYYGPEGDRQKTGFTFTPEQVRKVADALTYILVKAEKEAEKDDV